MLIEFLFEYQKRKGHDITIVFDGWKSGGIQESHSVIGGIRIIYSRLAERADAVIKRLISSDKREWIVVTSDRDIAAYAWTSGSVPIPSEKFLKAMEQKEIEGETSSDENHEEYGMTFRRRGNPQKLSKKEKTIKRILSKL